MHYYEKQQSKGLRRLKLATLAVLIVCLSLLPSADYCLKPVVADSYLLSPSLSAGRVAKSRTLSVLFDSDSMFGAVNRLCNTDPAFLSIPEVAEDVLRDCMSDFYWTRILALVLVKEYIELDDGVVAEDKISGLMVQIDSMDISPIVHRELRHLLFLASGIEHEFVAQKANEIISSEVQRVLDYVENELNDDDQDVLSLFLARREYAGSRILGRLGSELFENRPYPAAQWKDFNIGHKAIAGGDSFPVMHPEYNGHTRNLPAALNWQIVSDIMGAQKWLKRARDKKGQAFSAMLNILSDYNIFENLLEHYQNLLDEFLENNPTQEQIDYFLTALSTVLAFHPSNSVEKGRVGAIMVAPNIGGKKLKIVGCGFDGAPVKMMSDRQILGRELWVDRYVPRRDEDRDKPDFRFLFILRRSPCAEKKALMQAVSAIESGDLDPDAVYGSVMYTSRTPCYQCVMALSQLGIKGVSAGDYQFRDDPSRKVDEACGFEHSHPEMTAHNASVDSILTHDFDSVSELSRWARILNVLRALPDMDMKKGLFGKIGLKERYPEREFLDTWDFNVVRSLITDYKGAMNVKKLFRKSHYKSMLVLKRYTLFLNALYDYTYKIRKEIDDRAVERRVRVLGRAA